MTTQEIEKYFEALNDELDRTGVKGAFQPSHPEGFRVGTGSLNSYEDAGDACGEYG